MSFLTVAGIGLGLFLQSGCDGQGALPQGLTPLATAASIKTGETGAAGGQAPKTLALPPLPPLAGDRLFYRLVDHAGEAQLDLQGQGPGLAERLLAFDSPYKLVSPYSGLRGETALRVIEVAIPDPLVEKYPRSPAQPGTAGTGTSAAPPPPPRFDPVWNRYRGVYESKVALFAPAPSCYHFELGFGSHRHVKLSLNAAAIPSQRGDGGGSGADVDFTVALDKQTLWHAHVSRKDGTLGRWLPAEIELPAAGGDGARRTLSLCTKTASTAANSSSSSAGPAGTAPAGTAVWGNPELFAEGDGAVAPNLLLILVDTLRVDALPVMPRLKSYAHDSVFFSQAVSAATWTRPALLGLLGGDLPTAIGQSAEDMIPSERDRKRFYALDRRLLPRLLREAGYKVTSIGNNFFLLGYPQIGLSLGFDEVADVRHPVEDSPAISRAAVAFLRQNQRRSFFLQLHYDAPHWPYTPPAEYLRGIPDELVAKLSGLTAPSGNLDPQARAYLGEAAYADAQLAIVLDELKRLGLAERTLVVVLGDHGEVFDPQHNHFVEALHQPTIYHHGWSAYDEVLRVPLVLAMPGRLPASVEVQSQVRLIDVAPTALELLGLGAWRSLLPSGARGAGQSLMPLILAGNTPGTGPGSGATSADRPAFTEGQNVRTLRSGGYLYLRRSDPRLQRAQGGDGIGPIYRVSEELYDLGSDPQQHHDLLASLRASAEGGANSQQNPLPTGALGQTLARLREEFARYAPLPPEQGLPLTHLLLAPDAQAQHLLTGTLSSNDQALSVQGVRSGEVVPRGPGRIDVTLRPGGSLDVLVDPTARLELSLFRDGLALTSRELLLGPFSLPLLSGASALTIDGAMLDRLSAAYSPVPGERGEVLLWRDQAAPGVAATATARPASSASEVATLMRDWGYARADSQAAPPATPAPRPPDGGPAVKASGP